MIILYVNHRFIEPFTNERDKNKFCINCAIIATQIAVFDVVGASILEKYCDVCVKNIEQAQDSMKDKYK
jgi:hypothetical protein